MRLAPLVTVVVAARDALPDIRRLLDALAVQTLPRENFEVIVVDDGSTDATGAFARDHGLARVLAHPSSRGSYAARNTALAEARAPVIATTDADCVPADDWLERGLRELADQSAGLLAGHVNVPLPERPRVSEALDIARFLDQQRAVERSGYAATANLFLRREVFDRAGCFDPRMTSGGDVEFCARAVAAGFTLRYGGSARVTHPPRARPVALARKAFRVGVGMGQMRRFGVGPWNDRRLPWTMPGAWRPTTRLLGLERLEAAGYLPSGHRRLALSAGQYVLLQLPMLAGQARGQLVGPRRPGRA